jgi:oligosaccharide repeat unit polymerase
VSASDGLVLTLGFGVVSLLIVAITRRTKEFLSAAVLFSLAWGLNLVFCEALPFEDLRLAPTTLAVAIGAWVAFLLGFLASCSFRWPLMRGPASVGPTRGKLLLVALIALQAIAVLLELKQTVGIIDVQGLVALPGKLLEARLSGATAEAQVPIWGLWRWDFVFYLPLAFLLYKAEALRLRSLIMVTVWALGSALLKFTRAPALNVVTLCAVGMWVVWRYDGGAWRAAWRRLAVIVVVLAGFGVLFVGMEISLARRATASSPMPAEVLLPYIGGPLRAYQDVLQSGDWWRSGRVYSLDSVDFLAFKLGLKPQYEGQIRPEIRFGTLTNLYTYLDAFTLDAGVPGALAGSLALGAGVGWLFFLARSKGSYWSVVMYGYAAYGCFMAGANNEFIRFNFFLVAALSWFFQVMLTIRLKRAPAQHELDGATVH